MVFRDSVFTSKFIPKSKTKLFLFPYCSSQDKNDKRWQEPSPVFDPYEDLHTCCLTLSIFTLPLLLDTPLSPSLTLPNAPNRLHNCACHPCLALKTRHWNYHLRYLCVLHSTKAEKVRYVQPSMMRSSFRLTESCDTFCDKLLWEDISPTLNINMFVFSKYVLAFTHKHCMYI